MPDAQKVTAIWTGLAGTPYLSTLWLNAEFFSTPLQIQGQAAGVFALLCEAVDNSIGVTIQPEVSRWSSPSTIVSTQAITGGFIPGVKAAGAAPRATQGLLRLRTDGFNGNRRILGHMYVPGVTVDSVDPVDGKPLPAYRTLLDAAGLAMDNGNHLVPSRKQDVFVAATTVTADNEFAVLRSRRD